MRASRLAGLFVLALGCGSPPATDVPDTGPMPPMPDAGHDAGPAVPASTAHCTYEPQTATAHAGGTVTDAPIFAGIGESVLHVPVGVTMGGYADKAEGTGSGPSHGFIDDRRTEIAGAFGPSIGIETWPRARALAISTGCATAPTDLAACEDTVLLLKADIAIGYQGLEYAVEQRLGADFAGRVVIATSHSHSSFANYTAHAGMQVGFGPFRRSVFDAIVTDLEAVARHALTTRLPARIGFAHDPSFDLDDRVNRDRRTENDTLAGGPRDDHDLFVIRVDTYDPAMPSEPSVPLAVLPVFGMHGTIQGANNVLVSTDAPGGVERVLEEHFDHPVLVMHLQGAGGDVSPAGLGGTQCATDALLCNDYMRAESVGWNAVDAIVTAWTSAGTGMMEHAPMEMVTRSIDRGPDWTRFTIRGGDLSYAPWDGFTPADRNVVDATGALISPIDEFNAPEGAALCGGSTAPYLATAQIPGTRGLTDYPYASCNRIEAIQHLLSSVLSIDLGSHAPICDTTRTTISALRIGDWYMSVLPGEPLTLSVDRMRSLVSSTVPADHHIVVGYAHDNNGYILLPEDWIRGGYEPTITFWGPLDGEMLLEQTAQLFPLLTTTTREDAASGLTHVQVPPIADEGTHRDASPMAGTVPATVPAYLATGLLPAQPTSMQPAASIRRLESVFFSWIGADPLDGTPEVTIEMRQSDGSFAPLTRHSGRVVSDGDFLLSWTPDPLNHDTSFSPRTHYWTVQWQAVPALGQVGFEGTDARARLPLGTYRIVVVGPSYSLHSNELTVTAGNIEITRTGGTGTNVEVTAGYHAPNGYRMIDPGTGATPFAPIRGGTVEVAITTASGTTTMTGVAVDTNGHVAFDAGAGATSIRITDPYGNTGTLTL